MKSPNGSPIRKGLKSSKSSFWALAEVDSYESSSTGRKAYRMAIASSFRSSLVPSWTWKTSYQAIAILLRSAHLAWNASYLSQKTSKDSWGKKQKSYCGNRSRTSAAGR